LERVPAKKIKGKNDNPKKKKGRNSSTKTKKTGEEKKEEGPATGLFWGARKTGKNVTGGGEKN